MSAKAWAKKQKTGSGFTSFDIPEGVELMRIKSDCSKRLDILSYRVGKGNPNEDQGTLHFERTFWVHRLGPDNRRYVCPAMTANKPCPVCEYRAKLRRDPDADDELKKSLSPSQRQIWLVYDLEEMDKGVQLLEYSYHQFGRQIKAELDNADEDDEYEFFSDLEDGLTVRVAFEENKPFGFEAVSVNFKKRRKQYDASLADELPCLDDLIKIEPYDKLKAILLQTEGEEDEDSEPETEQPPRRRSKPKPEPESEDGEEEPPLDDDDDEDEPPKPKPKRGRPKAKPKPEPEDDDWDEDEDEPPPKRKRKPEPKPAADDDDWDNYEEDD